MKLRVAFPSKSAASQYEPTKILLAPEYIFLESIYSPLVEFSSTGEITAGVAKDFAWEDGRLRLIIRDDLVASDGKKIDAEDVVFSLKRVIVLSGNTHGNLVDLLCGGHNLKVVDEYCPGISSEGSTVILNPGKFSPFLVPMLAAIDFAVIPRRAVDPKSLSIIDYSITSGPYFVETDLGGGHITLKLNPRHYHASKDLADVIELEPTTGSDPGESLALLKSGAVDCLTTIDKANPDEVLNFAKNQTDINLHTTLRIRIMLSRFTDKGADRFTLAQRAYIGKLIRNALKPVFETRNGFEPADQLFPQMGEAGLSDAEVQNANSTVEEAVAIELPKSIVIATVRVGDVEVFAKALEPVIPGLKIYDAKKHPNLVKGDDRVLQPDILIAGPDMAFLEDISLLSYAISTRSLGLSGEAGRKWLKNYMETEDKASRLKQIRQLHFDAIAQAQTIPIASVPYVAIARKPWNFNLSMLFANNPLWQITKK